MKLYEKYPCAMPFLAPVFDHFAAFLGNISITEHFKALRRLALVVLLFLEVHLLVVLVVPCLPEVLEDLVVLLLPEVLEALLIHLLELMVVLVVLLLVPLLFSRFWWTSSWSCRCC